MLKLHFLHNDITSTKNTKILIDEFFKTAINLKKIPRQGWKNKLGVTNPESVADHCFSTSIIAMVLSDLQNLDTAKILKMSLLHDLAESITGDLTIDEISKKDKEKLENETMKKIIDNLPHNLSEEYFYIWNEYQERKTDEAIFLHEVDKLEMAFQANIYAKEGIQKQKLQPFSDTARNEIKNKYLSEILSKLLQ